MLAPEPDAAEEGESGRRLDGALDVIECDCPEEDGNPE
jgi:hypothetical protein